MDDRNGTAEASRYSLRARVWATLLAAGLIIAACSPTNGSVQTTTTTGIAATTTAPPTTIAPTTTVPPDVGPVAAPVRHPVTSRSIYFVMTDRFENGAPENDTGGITGGPLDHGFLPEDTGFYHGGDVVGLTERLPYLAELGVSAIWVTPPFVNRTVQGDGTIDGSSAGYHGYWQIDWSRIDPHLGSDEEMLAFIDAAHANGMLVFFDMVVNHTGDVITYEEGSFAYVSKASEPYRDADGVEFDDVAVAGSDQFPELDPDVSFPHTPGFLTPEDAQIKSPAWLNDLTLYHNRGDSSFSGENSTYGDFFGLDDLFTEHPAVVEGMIDLYSDVIRRYGIDGFRIDTAKHVNDEFWAEFVPAINAAAAEAGRPEFFLYGEVFSSDQILLSRYTTELGMHGVLDFIINGGLTFYVAEGLDASTLAEVFDRDDWYTDTDSNASMLVKFFGNHDKGRMGRSIFTANSRASDEELVQRMALGFDLLFLTRGVPVVYYGDEQGFAGTGGDQQARQSMFPSVTPDYVDQPTIGSGSTPADDNFDEGHPLFNRVSELTAFRAAHPTIVTGAQIVHEPEGPVFAMSRVDRTERIEYVVVANNATEPAQANVAALSPANTTFSAIWGIGGELTSSDSGLLTVEVPPLSTIVLRAESVVPIPEDEPSITVVRPMPGTEITTERYRIEAELGDRRYAEVTFAVAIDGGDYEIIGTDDAPPYRVYWSTSGVDSGASVEFIATVDDGSGRLRSDLVEAVAVPAS